MDNKWKDTEENPEFKEGTIEDNYDEHEYPNWEKQNKFSLTESLLKKIEIPLIFIAVSLVIVIVIFFISITGKKNTIKASRIETLEQRLAAIEDRLFKVEGTNIPTEAIGEQNRTIDALNLKISKLETAVTLRMDQLSKDLSELNKMMASVAHNRPVDTKDTSVKEPAAKTLYHQVRSGDTLFGIGQQYGVSVDELMKMNGMSRGKAIYPGQKLIVGISRDR